MGSGGAKKTNRMLGAQTSLANQQAGRMGDRSQSEYDYMTGQRGKITDALWNAYANAPELAGGHGGTADWYGPAAGFYRNMMETGGMTDADKAGYRSWTTAPISGFYTGLKNEMARKNAALGGYAGYNSQSQKLTRDAARQGFLTAQESESGLLDMLNKNKFQGAAGLESSYHKGSPGSAGSAGAAGSQDYYLRQLMGLMGDTKDLPYAQLEQSGLNLGMNTINSRQNETPLWQKTLTGLIPSAAGAAIGAFSGGGRKQQPSYTNPYGGD